MKNKDEGDLKHLSLHFLILRGTLLASQNKSLPVTNARRPINLSTQGRSQVSKQDEASLERRRREPLGGSGGMPPPPPPPPENLEIYRLINALVSISRGIFLQTSQFWASVEVHFSIA